MLNLHPPFRHATTADAQALTGLIGSAPEDAIVAEADGRIVAALAGRPTGEQWRIEALALAPGAEDDLARRILAVADALAADEGLGTVTVTPEIAGGNLRALLDAEGFRASEAVGDGRLARPVIPQG